VWVDRCHVSDEPVAAIFILEEVWRCIKYLDANFCKLHAILPTGTRPVSGSSPFRSLTGHSPSDTHTMYI
jgi:hypothetical protein